MFQLGGELVDARLTNPVLVAYSPAGPGMSRWMLK
jgi:hypothetical protein